MPDYKKLSEKLTDILGLEQQPVGVLFIEGDERPAGYSADKKYTFCQFLMKARAGEKLLAGPDNITCANGASALGFMEVPDRLRTGDFLEYLGTFTKEGARRTMEEMPRIELNRYSCIALAPLSQADFDPDVIVLETMPEHLMWLSLAALYEEGGRLNFSSSISNGTCVDVTAVPHLTQKLNVSLGCYGCRNATLIPDTCLLAGFPGSHLERLVVSLKAIKEKAMPRTREKRAFSRLLEKEGRN